MRCLSKFKARSAYFKEHFDSLRQRLASQESQYTQKKAELDKSYDARCVELEDRITKLNNQWNGDLMRWAIFLDRWSRTCKKVMLLCTHFSILALINFLSVYGAYKTNQRQLSLPAFFTGIVLELGLYLLLKKLNIRDRLSQLA
jgi:hypothetical protein